MANLNVNVDYHPNFSGNCDDQFHPFNCDVRDACHPWFEENGLTTTCGGFPFFEWPWYAPLTGKFGLPISTQHLTCGYNFDGSHNANPNDDDYGLTGVSNIIAVCGVDNGGTDGGPHTFATGDAQTGNCIDDWADEDPGCVATNAGGQSAVWLCGIFDTDTFSNALSCDWHQDFIPISDGLEHGEGWAHLNGCEACGGTWVGCPPPGTFESGGALTSDRSAPRKLQRGGSLGLSEEQEKQLLIDKILGKQ